MSGKDIRDTFGLLAVVGGLVFVGMEIQQNNTLATAAAYESMGTRLADSWRTLGIEHPELGHLIMLSQLTTEDVEALSDTEVTQLVGLVVSMLRHDEITWRQVELGLLDESALNYFGNDAPGARDNALPNLQVIWPIIRPWMSPDFAAHIEGSYGLTAP